MFTIYSIKPNEHVPFKFVYVNFKSESQLSRLNMHFSFNKVTSEKIKKMLSLMFLLNLIIVARRLVFKILTRFCFIKSPVKKN